MFVREWTIQIPRANYYSEQIATWKTTVETRVDAGSPLPSTGPMPAPPTRWNDPSACEASLAEMRACFDANTSWGTALKQWLNANTLPLLDTTNLPDYPVFEYARSQTSLEITRATRGAYEAARRSIIDPIGDVRIALSFHDPVTKAQLDGLLPLLPVGTEVAFRGIFDPQGAAITGGQTNAVTSLTDTLSGQLDAFYSQQLELTEESITTIDETVAGSPEDPVDPDDLPLLAETRADLLAMKSSLTASGAFVSGVALELPVARLGVLLALPDNLVKHLQILPADDSGRGVLDAVSTNAELLAGDTAARSTAGTSSASPANGRPNCAEANDSTNARTFRSQFFMPNNWAFKSRLFGNPDADGRYHKLHQVGMIWRQSGVLSWFCGDDPHDRGFEPETAVDPAGERWSTDQINDVWQTNLPSAYLDDLACGRVGENGCNQPFEKETYANFSVATANGSALRYRKHYFASNRTNAGDTNTGTVVVRGQQTTRADSTGEHAYCQLRGRNRSACYFGDTAGTVCMRKIPIENRVRARRVATWPTIAPLCSG